MFSLSISGGERSASWRADDGVLRRGSDWILPLRHGALTTRAFSASARLFVAFLEDHRSTSVERLEIVPTTGSAMESLRLDVEAWPLHWMWLDISENAVCIRSSGWPTVPVFLARNTQVARASWDPVHLYGHVRPKLEPKVTRHFLDTFEQPYRPDTIIADILLLPALHETLWRPAEGWTVSAWRSEPHAYPRELKVDADPVATIELILSETVRRLTPEPGRRVGCGLSGGLDSAAVAGTLHAGAKEFRTFGVVFPGEVGELQSIRRRALTDSWQVTDFPVSASEAPSWSAATTPDRRWSFVPWEELNYELFDRLYALASAEGCKAFFTGFGGDELFGSYRGEPGSQDIISEAAATPSNGLRGQVPEFGNITNYQAAASAMEAASSTAAQMLRHGLWPVHPLVSREIVAYCAALPYAWRRDRRLFRALLDCRGVDPRVAWEASPESFTPLFERSLIQCPELERLLSAQRLVRDRLVNDGEPLAMLASYRSGRSNPTEMLRLIAIAVAELTLASLEEAQGTRMEQSCFTSQFAAAP